MNLINKVLGSPFWKISYAMNNYGHTSEEMGFNSIPRSIPVKVEPLISMKRLVTYYRN